MSRTYKQFDLVQRLKLRDMLDSGYSVIKIAELLGFHRSSIYNEIERGKVKGIYDPYYAQELFELNSRNRGRPNEILKDKSLAEYIANLILTDHLSPEQIVDLLKEDNRGFREIPQSPTTIYSAIDKGLLPNITRETLLPRYSTVFNGGQVHIPKWVLEYLNIQDGDVLQLEITQDNGIFYRKKD